MYHRSESTEMGVHLQHGRELGKFFLEGVMPLLKESDEKIRSYLRRDGVKHIPGNKALCAEAM